MSRPNGMSLRDWFAGQALAGATNPNAGSEQAVSFADPEHVARYAWAVADAVMAERERKKGERK